jgi:hypothetical protein
MSHALANSCCPEGEVYRIENAWYAIDITARSHAGGIASLREKGRGVQHFRAPQNLIQPVLHYGGHKDQFMMGRSLNEMKEVAMDCSGMRHEGGAMRLSLEGVADEGQNIRTTVVCTLDDSIPLILWQRDYHFQRKKRTRKTKLTRPKRLLMMSNLSHCYSLQRGLRKEMAMPAAACSVRMATD